MIDVTRRYTRQWDEVISRRVLCEEHWLETHLEQLNHALGNNMEETRGEIELLKTLGGETRELKSGEEKGRITGEKEWKEARGEKPADSK